jgi:CubicO group peptidase (beta-lactamase class C family)
MQFGKPRCAGITAWLLVVLVLCPVAASPQATEAGFPPELEDYIEKTMREWQLPGAAVAVVKDGSVLLERGYGVRELGKPERVDARTMFDIASVTKTFTSAAIASLVDDGTLSLDDPLRAFLPELELRDPYLTANITLRDLLSHRTGLATTNAPLFSANLGPDQLLPLLRNVESVAPFRASYVYSNLGFTLAGEAAERASGKSWQLLVTDRLLRPLGMTRTTADFAAAPESGNIAVGHALFGGVQRPVSRGGAWRIRTAPAGAVQSCATDLAVWMNFQLGDGTHAGRRLLSADSMAAMHSPYVVSTTSEAFRSAREVNYFAGYGLGWQIFDFRGHLVWWHSGNGDGQVAYIGLLPELRLGVAVLVNSWKASALLNIAIAQRVFDYYLGAAPRDYVADVAAGRHEEEERRAQTERDLAAARRPSTSPSLAPDEYAGTYHDQWELPWTVKLEGKVLRLRHAAGEEGILTHWHHDTFRVRWSSPLRSDDAERPVFIAFRISATGVADGFILEPLFGDVVTARRDTT